MGWGRGVLAALPSARLMVGWGRGRTMWHVLPKPFSDDGLLRKEKADYIGVQQEGPFKADHYRY